jgi:ParB/RepB/Spo0J family partition protein
VALQITHAGLETIPGGLDRRHGVTIIEGPARQPAASDGGKAADRHGSGGRGKEGQARGEEMKKNETRDNIALSDIHVREGRLRKLDPKLVDTLAESMREQGQLQPILLRNRRNGYELIYGRHRLEAAKKLKMRIRAEVNFNLNDDDMLLAEIDENLIRGELDALERSEHMVKRKELYERKHPETKAGKSQAIGMRAQLTFR